MERQRALEKEKALRPSPQIESKPVIEENIQKSFDAPVVPDALSVPVPEIVKSLEDEITQKLQKLRGLYEKQLITQEEYEAKKADILSQL